MFASIWPLFLISIFSIHSTDTLFKALVYANHNLLKNKPETIWTLDESQDHSKEVPLNPKRANFHDSTIGQLPHSYNCKN